MAKRETYSTNIQCGDCESKGTGTFSELENLVYAKGGNLQRRTESVNEGFSMDTRGTNGIICDVCGSSNVDQV